VRLLLINVNHPLPLVF